MADRYLVDTNVLARMTRAQRTSPFMMERCRIPEEVLHEAAGVPGIEELQSLCSPITSSVLAHTARVLAAMEPTDLLVDLYKNQGNGDVLLVATALAEIEDQAPYLFGDQWLIASGDGGVLKLASRLAIQTVDSESFIALNEGYSATC